MNEAYLETWVATATRTVTAFESEKDDKGFTLFDGQAGLASRASYEDCVLAAAAPEMCRSLLMVEWGSHGHCCAVCHNHRDSFRSLDHGDSCVLDAALTNAGLKTQEQRDAARKEIGL
jgi:hypothetical protein